MLYALCQCKNLFSTASHLEFAFSIFEFLVIRAVPSWQGDEGRIGKKLQKASPLELKMADWHSICERDASLMGSHGGFPQSLRLGEMQT